MKEGLQQTIFDSSTGTRLHEYKISADELKIELSKFDLSENQSKVYIFLGKYGSKTAPEVSRALKIARTETYQLLASLQKKGIVLATFAHPIKFSALKPNQAVKTLVNAEKEKIKSLEKKEEKILKLWNSIPDFLREQKIDSENRFQMLEGLNPINAKLKEMVTEAKGDIKILGSEKDYIRFYHSDFLDNFSSQESNPKIITSCSDKTRYIFEKIKKDKIKCMPSKIKDEICFVMKDDKEMLFFTKKDGQTIQDISAMWTDSSALICSMKLLFDFIWASSKSF